MVAPPTTVAEEVGQPKVDRPVAQPLVEAAAVRDLVSIPLLLVGMAEVGRVPIWVALRSMTAVAEPGALLVGPRRERLAAIRLMEQAEEAPGAV